MHVGLRVRRRAERREDAVSWRKSKMGRRFAGDDGALSMSDKTLQVLQ